ncbi:hypothetical protein P9139_08135 [Curtobacterium flaccumfaciens]|nr:hypothetical protein P9139_08135 [Curtobacterium flaccumfaciens]
MALLAGSMIAKWIVRSLHARAFELLIDAVLVAGAAGTLLSLV